MGNKKWTTNNNSYNSRTQIFTCARVISVHKRRGGPNKNY